MSNRDRPRGFEPVGELLGTEVYEASSAIGVGDAVRLAGSGRVQAVNVAGSVWAGAVLGVAIQSADEAGDRILVADHPEQRFRVQADDDDIDAQADKMKNYSIVGNDRDSALKNSRQELKADSGANTATLSLKLERIDRTVRNDLGDKVDCIVKINNHQRAAGTGTATV